MKNYFILFFLLLSLLSWAKTGFYSGAFEPPSLAEVGLARSSLEECDCDELIIMVDRLSPDYEIYRASATERVEMLKTELGDLDHIHVVVEPWSGKELYLNNLYTQDEVYVLEKKNGDTPQVSASTCKLIENQQLYTHISESMAPLKQSLHQEAFQAFLRELSFLFPQQELHNIQVPQFAPLMSHLGWADQFISTVIREIHLNPKERTSLVKKRKKCLFPLYVTCLMQNLTMYVKCLLICHLRL